MNILKTILFFSVTIVVNTISAQGLFKYFNWTAYSDGAERIDHLVIDFNVDRFQQLPTGVEQGYYNFGVDAYMFHDHPMNKKGTLAWAVGIGFSGFNVHHNSKITYKVDQNQDLFTEWEPYQDGLNYKKNKISLNYFEVPVELRIRSMKESVEDRKITNFRLYLGFKGGYLINSHTKYKDDESKVKVFDIKNLLDYRYGPTVRIGFKKIAIHGFYSLTSIFEEGKGPELYPFSVGLTWMRL